MVTVENTPVVAARAVAGSKARPWRRYAPAGVIVLAFLPILMLFAFDLWARPHYRFFPLVLPGAAALAWKYGRRLGPIEPGESSARVAAALAAAAWLLLAVSVAFITPWFAAVGALVAAAAAVAALGGWPLARAVAPARAFLWLAIPPPRKYDFLLVTKLQNVVSRWSDMVLDTLGVTHVMDGNVVQVAGRELLVDQACSGIYSLFTLLIGALFYALWVRVSWVRGLFLAAASIVWVLAGNLTRIVLVVLLSTRYGIDAATGWKHEAIGLVMFVVMLGLVLSTDRMVSFWLSAAAARLAWSFRTVRGRWEPAAPAPGPMHWAGGPANAPAAPAPAAAAPTQRSKDQARLAGIFPDMAAPPPPPRPAPKPQAAAAPPPAPGAAPAPARPAEPDPGRTELAGVGRTWLGSRAVAVAFGVLFVPQFLMPGVHWKDVFLDSDVYPRRFASMDKESMPATVGAFRRGEFGSDKRDWDNSWGEYSRYWSYGGSGRSAAVSLDYQFVEWHELTLCYRSRGWEMYSRRVEQAPPAPGAAAGGGGPVVVAEFKNLEGRYGYLVYGMYDRLGRPLDPPETQTTAQLLADRLGSWVRSAKGGGRDGELLNYQLQVFSTGEAPPTEAERAALHGLHAEARARVERTGLRAGEKTP